MSDSANQPPISISLLALPETMPAALYGLYEVFAAVGTAWTQLTGERVSTTRLKPLIVSPDGRTFASPLGALIGPDASLDQTAASDVVIVTDLSLPGGDPAGRWPDAVQWLRNRYEAGAMVCSVCTGALVLAESGLLDGNEATTH
jgi:transcriptional regulator GlxA family with amidase domain